MERVANKRTKDDILLPVFAARLRPSTECLGESLSFNMFLPRVFSPADRLSRQDKPYGPCRLYKAVR